MSGAFLGIGAKLAGSALFSKAKGIMTSIPPQVWQALAVLGYALALYLTHSRAVHEHDTAIIATNNAQWEKRLTAEHADALKWKAKADQQAATIAQDERTQHEETVRLNAAAADALRLRGPGAAAAHCGQGDHPGAAPAADRHGQAAPETGAAADQVPSGDWAVVPWSWLVTVVQEHDDLLNAVAVIEDNDRKQRAAWPKNAKP